MNPLVYPLSHQQSIDLLAELLSEDQWGFAYNGAKHTILVEQAAEKILSLRLPLLANAPQSANSLTEYLAELRGDQHQNYVLLLMQAGQATLGHYVDGQLVNHKVIRKYMVRKGQGKAQLNHLKTKGKSRYGSRLRLQESLAFFVELNQKMKDWAAIKQAEAIFYSASPQLWPYLFDSQESCPFDKDDPRLRRVPLDVKQPSHAELKRINWTLRQGQLLVFDRTLAERFESL